MDEPLRPFPFYGPLEPDQVTGREELIADLSDRLLSHRPAALLGPRRYGKTSVLRKVSADLAGVGPETIWIDLFGLLSMADLAGRLDAGLAKARGPLLRAVKAVAESLRLTVGAVSIDFSRGQLDRTEAGLVVHSLLATIVKVSERHRLLLVLDEFSGVADVKGAAAALRTALQHHYRDISIVFAGSEPSTMQLLFGDRAQPFFGQAEIVYIEPLTDAVVREIVADGFVDTGRDAGPTDVLVARFARGHPQRAMQLADAVWRRTDEGATADEATWAVALGAVRDAEDDANARQYKALPTGHQRTLRAAAADGRVFGSAAEVVGLAPGTAAAAVDKMVGDGLLMRTADDSATGRSRDRLDIVDPLFADWIRRRFPVPA
jgi:hypothetical protein